MNRKLVSTLFIALLIASVCAYLVYSRASSLSTASRPAAVTRVVAAADNFKIGTLLTASNLTTIEIAGTLPAGMIVNPVNAVGRGVISNLYKGEPIIENRLAAPGAGAGLASIIPPGMRACAVKVDDVVGVAGFVIPGMRVDVLISGVPPGIQPASQGILAKTILQNIEVLSAGTDIQKDAEGKPKQVQVVNLLVTPEQAVTLSLVSKNLSIQLVLRNPLDMKTAFVPTTAMGELFSGQNVTTLQQPNPVVRTIRKVPSSTYSIEMISGAKRSELKVGSPEGKK